MANPNPSPETRFKPGNLANPGGKTKELKRIETEAAEMAAKLRHAMLSAMTESLSTGADPVSLMTGDALRLFKDSEDRAHGTPKQSVLHGEDPENPLPGIDASKLSAATLRELMAAHEASATDQSGPDSG